MIGEEKELLRKEISARCAQLDLTDRARYLDAVLANSIELLKDANKIAIYHAYKWELSLTPLIEYCQKIGKELYQPIAYKETRIMRFAEYDRLNSSIFSVANSIPKGEIQWYNLDLIFLPLVAIDRNGYRLGKGGGYYDATLKLPPSIEHLPILCGVGFGMQMLDTIPVAKWDVKLNYFLSERGLIKF